MCLTFFYLTQSQKISQLQSRQFAKNIEFLIGFNRDQQIQRKTKPFDKFQQDQNIYAGRDFISGGTWLGINIQTGIMVILTNYDIPQYRYGKSRGKVVYQILSTKFISQSKIESIEDVDKNISIHLSSILKERQNYSPFNLVVYNIFNKKLHYICSQSEMKQPILLNIDEPYGLCNCQIKVLWPKTQYGLFNFKKLINKLEKMNSADQIISELSVTFKDKKLFSENLQDQSSIFVQPYYCILQKAQRMTKSTFYGILQRPNNQNKNYFFHIKQITYDKQLNQSQKTFKLEISLQKFKEKYIKTLIQQ